MANFPLDAVGLLIQERFAQIVPGSDFLLASAPILVFLLGSVVALLAGLFFKNDPDEPGYVSYGIGVITSVTAALVAVMNSFFEARAFLGSGFLADHLSFWGFLVISFGTLFSLVAAAHSLSGRKILRPEMVSLLLFASAGMMIQIAAGEFLSFFVGLEIMSISIYVLVGYQRYDIRGLEAAIKYFMLGATATALLLFGMGLLYISTGSLRWAEFANLDFNRLTNPVSLVGAILFFAGLSFKLGLVPFHSWAPDVYQGSHSVLTGYMATLVKVTIVFVLLRILSIGFRHSSSEIAMFFWITGVGSVFVGSFLGLAHNSIKRMLAYSSIANAGYFCLGFVPLAVNPQSLIAKQALLAYVVTYVILNLGVFAILAWIEDGHGEDLLKENLNGFGKKHPFLGVALTILLFGLAGIPPLPGFFGKLLLLQAAMSEQFIGLTVIMVLLSCVSLFYYLSLMINIWFKSSDASSVQLRFPDLVGMKVLVFVTLILSILIGVFGPRWAFDFDYTNAFEIKNALR